MRFSALKNLTPPYTGFTSVDVAIQVPKELLETISFLHKTLYTVLNTFKILDYKHSLERV